jgi:hypothetical protein
MNDRTLTESQIADLRCLAGMIIPASAKHGVPGADDDVIFADILTSIGRDRDRVLAALAKLRTLAGGPFVDLDSAHRGEVAGKLRAEGGGPTSVLTRIVLLEVRPPFPKGHVVEQGDWSLLDPVRSRRPFWRSASD